MLGYRAINDSQFQIKEGGRQQPPPDYSLPAPHFNLGASDYPPGFIVAGPHLAIAREIVLEIWEPAIPPPKHRRPPILFLRFRSPDSRSSN